MTKIEPNEAEMLAAREVIDYLCPEFDCECGPENPGAPFPCPRCGTHREVTRIVSRAVRPRWSSEKPTVQDHAAFLVRLHDVEQVPEYAFVYSNADGEHFVHSTDSDINGKRFAEVDGYDWAEIVMPLEPEESE